ncbi:MAG: choice-of-anchor B family protein [Phycisphaerales bacterium]|nr:choice-of-anchor B family protein [Phycisphaerales bacterium]
MKRFLAFTIATLSVAFILPSLLFAHPDDPKVLDIQPPFAGSGWRLGDGAAIARGVPPLFDSDGIQLMSWLTLTDFGTGASRGDDCWGYTSPSGREYGIMGTTNAIVFVEITNPLLANLVGTIPAPTSIWHDVKTFGTYAYAVSEGGDGIKVIDLSNIDSNGINRVTLVGNILTGGVSGTHNVVINEDSGYLYRCGGGNNIGLRIYDLNTDPANPSFVSSWTDRYVHDAQIVTYTDGPYAGREIAFCCSGFNNGSTQTGLDILDVTDKGNLVNMSRISYPNEAYSHQAWLSDDKKYLFLNDERDEPQLPTTTHVIDVSNLENPMAVNTFTNGNGAIGHNLYLRDGFIYEANYRSGLRIFNALDPITVPPTEVGFFDTYPDDDAANFNGVWSIYPFFDSGIVIASDIERGIFVFDVTEAVSTLKFTYPDGIPQYVDPAGGTTLRVEVEGVGNVAPQAGTGQFHYDVGGGLVTVPMTQVRPNVYDAVFPAAACGQDVTFFVSADSTTAQQYRSPLSAPANTLTVKAAFGNNVLLNHDFESDLGWTTEDLGAGNGQWERGVPVNDVSWLYDPAFDSDGSGQCWLTENLIGNTDVDGGATRLISPVFDLAAPDLVVSYDYMLKLTDDDGNDVLLVEVNENSGIGTWTEIARHDTDGGTAWRHHKITSADLNAAGVATNATMVFRFTVNDGGAASIVEAGLDAFMISTLACAAPCPGADGDLNLDNLIDGRDVQLFVNAVLGSPTGDELCRGDFDGNTELGSGDIPGFITALMAP